VLLALLSTVWLSLGCLSDQDIRAFVDACGRALVCLMTAMINLQPPSGSTLLTRILAHLANVVGGVFLLADWTVSQSSVTMIAALLTAIVEAVVAAKELMPVLQRR
jgi:hypothetical protein